MTSGQATSKIRTALGGAFLALALSGIALSPLAQASGIDESILPAIYQTTWNPGISGGIPADNDPVRPASVWLPAGDPYHGYSVNPALAGTANAAAFSTAFQAAINSAGAAATPTNRKIVLLKAGTYFVNPQVNSGGQVGIVVKVDNVTIRGEGAQNTSVIANGQINDYGTVILFGHRTGSSDSSFNVQNVTADALKGATTIQVANASGFVVGDVITIDHLDGPAAANGAVYLNGGYLWNYDAIYFKRQPTYSWSGPSTGAPSNNVDNVTDLASSNLAAQTDVPKWRSTGQQTEITAINGTTLTIKDPLNIDFPLSLSPQVWRTVPLNTASIPVGNRWCGLENLRVAGGNNQWGFPGGCIALSYMAYSWVKGVDADGERWTSDPVNHPGKYGYNIGLARSYRCVVRESFSHGATDENPGGQAYGIVIGVGSSACLVEDNISLNNDKPIVLNVTGGGNVIGYNYVDEAELWNSPGWLESAIEDCHASFTHNDLIEGNWSANLGGSTTHGNSGFHTYLRNYSNGNNSIDPKTANLRAVGVYAWMHSHAFIGNVLMGGNVYQTTPTSQNGTPIYLLGGLAPYDGSWDNGYALNHTYRDGNWDNVSNAVVWNAGSKTIPASFYLTAKPSFFGSFTWPWVDPTGTTRVYTLPAKHRYDSGSPFDPPPAITSATTASGTVGTAFSYQITATNGPLSYGASPLPAGLSINTLTGLISGTPTASGTVSVQLRATNDNGAGTATLTLTITASGSQTPVITSPTSASGKVGAAFNYQITATNSPTSYGATNLPAWASINTSTGVISGTPTAAGSSSVTISAKNAAGTGSATLTLTIAANAPPTITSGPTATPNPALVGQSVAFSVAASDPDGDTLTYAWTFGDGGTGNTATASHVYTTAGTYSVTVKVSDTAGHSVTGSTSVTVNAAAVAPSITKQPVSQTVAIGQTATFSITASGTAPLSYQWQKNGANIASATSAAYITPATTTTDNGAAFRCVVKNSAGSATSNAATLTVTTGANTPPVITAVTATPDAALTGQRVTFAVTASDADGDTLAYAWDFGDGATGSGANPVHAYATAGTFTATVSVSDGHNAAVTASVAVYVTQSFSLSLNSGGAAVGRFKADANFTGGSTYATTHAVTTSSVSNPAPVAVYQSERRGNFSYAFSGLTTGATYKVRLHFAELAYSAAGQRLFNVAINGQQMLSKFDIVAAAGGEFIAVCKNFSVVPADGTITVTYTSVKNSAKSSGIEVIAIKAAPAPVQGAAALADATIAPVDDSMMGDAAPSDNSDVSTELERIDLGTVQLGKRFKLPLDGLLDNPKLHVRWMAVNRKQLPPGVSASGTFVGGKPQKAGAYTFQLKSRSSARGGPASITNTYTLTITP